MMRNDYRRALILLRSNGSLCSGHVRLERRTLMGSMYFLVQASVRDAALRAALVGRDKNNYYACDLGLLRRDGRGQATLTYSFDPRNICGRELEQYQLIVVAETENSGCEILLHGNVNGHADLNWERVRTAVCDLYASKPEENMSGEMPLAAELPEPPVYEENAFDRTEAPAPDPEEIQQEIRAEIQDEIEDVQENMRESEMKPEDSARETVGELREEIQGEILEKLLGIDLDRPWPESIDPLRLLFANGVSMENPPDDEYVYIAVPMPEDSGYTYCAVGVRVQNGAPVSVRYALPAAWAAEAPAGLEDYSWVGDQNRGWWMTQLDLYPAS